MRVAWSGKETFAPTLPTVPVLPRAAGKASPLTERFDGTRGHAQAMLLSYLRGTGEYYYAQVKRELLDKDLRKLKLPNFRSKAAQEVRDKRMAGREYNFLHLAFRYRGKANYRDSLFLAYGAAQLLDAKPFFADLATVARFAAGCALAYIERRMPSDHAAFRADLTANFAGVREFGADVG
jgi:hypothetical protein